MVYSYPRDSYYLETKYYVSANPDIREVFEEQLKRLRTDHFDFYLLHCVDENTIDAYMDEKKTIWGICWNRRRLGVFGI